MTGGERCEFARAWFASRAIDAEVVLTAARGHAVELARSFSARGFDRVVAWGGDGTVNEVAGPLIGSRVVLALIRAGSGDGVARGLGVPADPDRALSAAIGGVTVRMDVGWAGSRHFLNAAGFGFDAAVARTFNQHARRGLSGYVSAVFTTSRSYRCARYSVKLDGVTFEGQYFLVAFANGREYGNGFVLAADADPTDGMLDVVLVAGGSAVQQAWRARRLLLSPSRPARGLTRRRVREAVVSASVLAGHVDGDAFDLDGPVTVRVAPRALTLAVPASSRRSAEE
jgi:diacylglycerol kinase family enzyme